MQAQAETRKGAFSSSTKFRLSEIYASVQGEGLLTGTPSIFVRTSGCNLRCWFCDTRYASWEPEGPFQSADEIHAACESYAEKHVVLTGGEPTIYQSLPDLCHKLRQPNRHLTIETAGTVFMQLECDLISISPKLANSKPTTASATWQANHERRRDRKDVVQAWMQHHEYQLKFVVDSREDAHEVLEYLQELRNVDHERVLLMPQGVTQEELTRHAQWLVPWCEKYGLKFCPRAHIEWFGNRRAT